MYPLSSYNPIIVPNLSFFELPNVQLMGVILASDPNVMIGQCRYWCVTLPGCAGYAKFRSFGCTLYSQISNSSMNTNMDSTLIATMSPRNYTSLSQLSGNITLLMSYSASVLDCPTICDNIGNYCIRNGLL